VNRRTSSGRFLGEELADPTLVKARLSRMIEEELVRFRPAASTPGPAAIGCTGRTDRVVNDHDRQTGRDIPLREKRKVGLITVDTYRIAAVEQLAHLCRHHRLADGGRLDAARNARSRGA